MYFWQKPEGAILDDEYLGGTKNLYPCCLSWGRMVSVSFVSFEKYQLQMKKKMFEIFLNPFFCPKSGVEKNFLTPFLGENVINETLVYYTKPWTLYLVSVLRNRGWKMKNSQK